MADFQAIRDLELVRWPARARRAGRPELRADVLASPYTCWWLRAHRGDAGRPAARRRPRCPASSTALYDPAPDGFDAGFLAAIGVRTTVAALTRSGGALRRARPARRPAPRARLAGGARALSSRRRRSCRMIPTRIHRIAYALPQASSIAGAGRRRRPAGSAAIAGRIGPCCGSRPIAHARVARMLGLPLAEQPRRLRDRQPGAADRARRRRGSRSRWRGSAICTTAPRTAEARAFGVDAAGAGANVTRLAAALRDPEARELLQAESELDG